MIVFLNVKIFSVDKTEAHADRPSSKTDFVGPPAFGPLGLPTPEFDVPGRGNGIPNIKVSIFLFIKKFETFLISNSSELHFST